jgi:hypothetical protein
MTSTLLQSRMLLNNSEFANTTLANQVEYAVWQKEEEQRRRLGDLAQLVERRPYKA